MARRETISKKQRAKRTRRTLPPRGPQDVFSIDEFCAAHRLSPSMYWKLQGQGLGPREMRVGRRVLISPEAAEQWRRTREAAAYAQAQASRRYAETK